MTDLKVGQKLWFVPRHGTSREITITKLGRKWFETDTKYRFNIKTLSADGGQYMSPGDCHLDRFEYEAKRQLQKAWAAITQKLGRFGNWHHAEVTIEDIQAAAKLLRINLEPQP